MKPVLLAVSVLVLLGGCSLFDANEGAPDDAARTIAHQEEAMFLLPFNLIDSSAGDSEVVVDLTEGESALLASLDVTLRFAEKAADSRCPLGVDCFWAGEATVLLELDPEGQPGAAFTLTGFVGPEGGGEVTTDTLGFRITLRSLEPYPVDGRQQDASSTATLAVTRL